MITDRIRLAGIILSFLLILVFAFLILQIPFPAFAYAGSDIHLIPIGEFSEMRPTDFMWNRRSSDLIILALVLFSTAAATLTILHDIHYLPGVEME